MFRNLFWKQIVLSFALSTLLAHNVFALKSDQKQNLLLMADKIKFNNKQKIGHYLGHVSLKQGTSMLKANTAWTYTDENNQLKKAVALGTPLKQALFETLMDGQKEKLKGKADKITYFSQKQHLHLEGNALLTLGKNKYQAPLIIYDINKQRIISTKTSNHRSTITINEKIA